MYLCVYAYMYSFIFYNMFRRLYFGVRRSWDRILDLLFISQVEEICCFTALSLIFIFYKIGIMSST